MSEMTSPFPVEENPNVLTPAEIDLLFPRAPGLGPREHALPSTLPHVEYDPVLAQDPVNIDARPAYTLSDITRRVAKQALLHPNPDTEAIGRALVLRLAQENLAYASHSHTKLLGIPTSVQAQRATTLSEAS